MVDMRGLILEKLGNSVATLQRVMADDTLQSALAQAADLTANAMLAGRKLMIAGNGGSAADAQHL
ncbi:MAG: SIS domain-containing protein, partial [Terracidiphilus sp.]